jgi:2-oxo-4-hydroxy-4-carboxy-5-ureidoimidazoline decarboxylase
MNRISLEQLNAMNADTFGARLADIFEHAPWVAARAAAGRPYAHVDALHDAMMAQVRALSETELVALLAGHPPLAGAAARAGTMTADSTKEQGALALGSLSQDEFSRWDALNAAYTEKFGFPFIICVRRHTLASIVRSFERRLNNDRATELKLAVQEIGRVSRLRLAARIEGQAPTNISGQLTTHVLDTAHGRPAAQVRVELFETTPEGERAIASALTNGDGRTDAPLLDGAPLRIGTYELRFHIGEYYRKLGAQVEEQPFLDVVPIAFGIGEAEAHYHVPISVTPWAYATYRGS